MMLDSLYDPDDLVQLRDRDIAILTAAIRKELLTNASIHKTLGSSLERYTKALGITAKKRVASK